MFFNILGLRVGEEYQAKVEDTVLPGPGKLWTLPQASILICTHYLTKTAPPDYDEKAFMVWKPNDQLEDFKRKFNLSIMFDKL